ncbi:DUF427 domain-containing protein [Thiohalomonas denitrificans]|uniref:Uncharacterized conserved protein, DUF427 family n=1 Tax=Thiohalomonas denitrificans TaxID=415747 RepID=A0A1G5Q7C0_9GAMM|nr:DUF427 domain-containing protein [Thiohalomonas denitrificans]SCZ57775.1 Uncharacterized conserved protein, DUF427 family [Thiohalomonas denitrificans]
MTNSRRWMPSPKRVRVLLRGRTVADSNQVMLEHGGGRPPLYWFPPDDVDHRLLVDTGAGGKIVVWDVEVPGHRALRTAYAGEQGYIGFVWDRMDTWLEEDEEVFVHPRDPFVRVDVLRSSRSIRIEALGEVIAETRRPTLLFETGLPTRYYLPLIDTRVDWLKPSDTVTRCPYKGEAHYYSLRIGEKSIDDVCWYYRYPTQEVAAIAGLVCFYPERVDSLLVE